MRSLRRHFTFLLVSLLLAVTASGARTIVIDAGHGGHDRGGIPGQRYAEKTYALDVAQRLRSRLQSAGFRTVMTRNGDYFVSLRQRCAIANGQRGAVFISVHFNAGRREGANGIETYYYSAGSRSFAAAVHGQVVRAAGTENRGVRRRGFYVIRHTRSPAVLAELGFLTNRAEGARIAKSTTHRQKLADALARAITTKYR